MPKCHKVEPHVSHLRYFTLPGPWKGVIIILLPSRKGSRLRQRGDSVSMEAVALVGLLASIASLTEALATGANSLHSFIKDAKTIDKTIESLHRETKSLLALLETISTTLSKIRIQGSKIIEEHEDLWTCLTELIKDCDRTANAIKKELEGVEVKRYGIFSKPARYYKLKLKTELLERLWLQIRTHSQDLSNCLATINL